MKGQKKQEWINAGCQLVAQEGFPAVQVEVLARQLGKNKSSFYYYFGDLEIFEEALLEFHLSRTESLVVLLKQSNTIKPGMLDAFVDFKTDLFFHKQLRIHRRRPAFKACFEKVFEQFAAAVLDPWAFFLGLQNQKLLARAFLQLVAENFLLRITWEEYSYAWMEEYLDEVAVLLKQMHSGGEN